jgi:hypothetical protein
MQACDIAPSERLSFSLIDAVCIYRCRTRANVLRHFWGSPSSRGAGSTRMKIGICRGDPRLARVVAADQVQPPGELRLAATCFAPLTVSMFSEMTMW